MDIEEENEAGETAARGRLEGATTQRAAISEMDPSMVHEALMGDSAREAIINMYIFLHSSLQLRPIPAQLHSERRGGRKRRERVHGSDPLDVQQQRAKLRSVLQRSRHVRRVHQPRHRIPHRTPRHRSRHAQRSSFFLFLFSHLQGAKRVVLSEFPSYEEVHKDIYVRFRDFAVLESLRDLRSSSLGKLIRTQGVVTRRTSVFPQMLYVAFRCSFCNQIMEGIKQLPDREVKPDMCVFCQRRGGLQLCTENTVFRNYQKITLQESPGSVEAGRIPRSKVGF